jgi:hypothetical protein
VSFFVQAAAALAADARSFLDDLGRGFVLGGVAGAIVVVLRKSRIPAARQTLVLSRWTLAGIVAFWLFLSVFK